jgi:cell division septation protein DedD
MQTNLTGSSTNDWKIRHMQDIDKEKLRAFEQKMHDEGADGFADGPRPWETWDESGAQAGSGRRIWEGKARRIYKTAPVHRSIGDRILSGLAMISLTTMVIGITGVYLTEEKPGPVAWTAIQPTPIPLPRKANSQPLPERVARPAPVIAEIESLPAPAAGSASRTIDRPAAATFANTQPLLAETGTEPAGAAAAFVATAPAAMPVDEPAWDPAPAGNNSNIEIVTAPSALLLTSSTADAPEGSEAVSGMDMDPELAMEIATAPAVDSNRDAAPLTDATMSSQETGADAMPASTGIDRTGQAATPTAANMINRGTDSLAAADSAIQENDAAPAGFVSAAETDTAAESSADATEPTLLADSLTDPLIAPAAGSQDVATTDVVALETLPPAASDPAITTADEASGNTVVALAATEPAAVVPAPAAAAATPDGDWVVNLASYTYEAMARKKLAEFQAKGVTGEIERITVNDKPLYRIRVAGFESSRAARTSIPALQKTLGLEGAWIARR